MARKPVHLVFVEEKSQDGVDHNKFYDMFERDGELHAYWGRRQDGYEFGRSGNKTVYPLSKWDSKYKGQLKKGYEDKSHHYEDVLVVKKTGDMYAPIPQAEIAKIVERLQEFARQVIAANYSVSSGQVTKVMVDETQAQLDQMMNSKSLTEFNKYLKEIFKIIPRSMSRVDLYLAKTDTEMSKIISREQDLLDIMRGQVVTIQAAVDTDDVAVIQKTILEVNGIEIQTTDEKDLELIRTKLGADKHLLKNAWKVVNVKQKENYEAFLKAEGIKRKDTKLLWHGTRNENVWNILKSGLVLRPTNVVISGKMFGMGVYFASKAKKSIGYTSLSGSYWARGNSNTGFMILHEVAYGKAYDVHSFESRLNTFNFEKLRQACPGAHCLHAHAGQMLHNDEIIVYKEEQLSALYLVELGD